MIGERDDVDREVWIQVVGAVDYLRVTHRLGLTVWGALDEACRWWCADRRLGEPPASIPTDLPWDDPDPLRSSLEELLSTAEPAGTATGSPLGQVLGAALEAWVSEMARAYNAGHQFAHPTPTAGWPCPLESDDRR